MDKMTKAIYRAMNEKRDDLMRARTAAQQSHMPSKHILAEIQRLAHSMMKMELAHG